MSDSALHAPIYCATRYWRKIFVAVLVGGVILVAGELLAPSDVPHIEQPDHVPTLQWKSPAIASPSDLELGMMVKFKG